ncbi:hypothetical protein [Pelosinus sp. sgz500959]|uniref:hypothetical protein n=1 Tax=Pelosinus sp. sgz500959 TaxID=3242472 RepID=UPI00366BC1CA
MSIWQVQLDSRDVIQYRKKLNMRGFISANYYSSNGFDLKKMRKMALEGKIDAMHCIIGKSTRWYYSEKQAEAARLRGELY